MNNSTVICLLPLIRYFYVQGKSYFKRAFFEKIFQNITLIQKMRNNNSQNRDWLLNLFL